MHLYDLENGNLGANAVVGGGLPAITGAALAFQFRKQPRVGVAFFGDGATNTGTFHESLNLAQLWKVPALFVLEMNGWAESTPISQHSPIEDFSQRAVAFGMRSIDVDGQDVEAVYAATRRRASTPSPARGPVFLNVRTYRLVGHYIGDPQVYRRRASWKSCARRRIRSSSCAPGSASATRSSSRSTPRSRRSSRARSSSRRRAPTRSPRTPSSTSMPELTYREAVRDALSSAMRADDDVFIMGEDIAEMGGSMGVTQGMLAEFGPERVRNTPISEIAIVGAGHRRRDAGHAPGRRDHVPGLPDALDGAARQPGREAPDDVGRPAEGAADDPHAGRRGLEPGRAARAAARVVVRARARA